MILKTKIKHPAKPLNNPSNLILSKIALNTFVNNDIPTKKSNICIVYHYTPTKFPNNEAATKTKMDKNPDS